MQDPRLDEAAVHLQARCDAGEITAGIKVRVVRSGIDLHRASSRPHGSGETFRIARLTPLGRGNFGLAIVRHTGRLERTPFTGAVDELHAVMESMLAHVFDAG